MSQERIFQMKNLLIVIMITCILIGVMYLLFGEDIKVNSPSDVLMIFGQMWVSCFITLWLGYRIIFKKVRGRSVTDDIISGKFK